MANELLRNINQFARAFGQGVPGSQIQRQDEIMGLRRGLAQAAQQPGFNPTTSPMLQQLIALDPQEGLRQQTAFSNLESSRQQAMVMDAFDLLQMRDDPEQALARMDMRIQDGEQINSPMAETRAARDGLQAAINSGEQAQVDEFFDDVEDFVRSRGPAFDLELPDVARVQSSKILDDGSVIQVLSDQSTRFVDPAGNILTGAERAQALETARNVGIETQGARERKRQQQRIAQQSAKEAFDNLPRIRTAITNLDDVIRVIDEGAETGVVVSRLPSFRATAIELDNLRNRMGLDVIGGTTFGALSESELAFALDTALPEGLEPDELRDWAVRKRDAQQKALEALTNQARFFSRGGTIEELLDRQEQAGDVRQSGADVQVDTPAGSTIGRFQVEVLP